MKRLGLLAMLGYLAACSEAGTAIGNCNGDGICNDGETDRSCPDECTRDCDGVCELPRDCATCLDDCGTTLEQLCPGVCGNTACEPADGENSDTCPLDCMAPVGDCGDGACAADEDMASCPQDCSFGMGCGNFVCNVDESCTTCPEDCWCYCGDDLCDPEESCSTCAADCGACPVMCGDDVCQTGETCASCPSDCRCPVCGNGVTEGSEECDDGNTSSGDGCSSTC